jgi:hypothetical protein
MSLFLGLGIRQFLFATGPLKPSHFSFLFNDFVNIEQKSWFDPIQNFSLLSSFSLAFSKSSVFFSFFLSPLIFEKKINLQASAVLIILD